MSVSCVSVGFLFVLFSLWSVQIISAVIHQLLLSQHYMVPAFLIFPSPQIKLNCSYVPKDLFVLWGGFTLVGWNASTCSRRFVSGWFILCFVSGDSTIGRRRFEATDSTFPSTVCIFTTIYSREPMKLFYFLWGGAKKICEPGESGSPPLWEQRLFDLSWLTFPI